MSSKINLQVQYCGGWGYKRYCDALFNKLEDQFPGELNLVGKADSGTTGNFEVTLNGDLIHSKKAGKGKAESQAEVDAIIAAIEKAKGK